MGTLHGAGCPHGLRDLGHRSVLQEGGRGAFGLVPSVTSALWGPGLWPTGAGRPRRRLRSRLAPWCPSSRPVPLADEAWGTGRGGCQADQGTFPGGPASFAVFYRPSRNRQGPCRGLCDMRDGGSHLWKVQPAPWRAVRPVCVSRHSVRISVRPSLWTEFHVVIRTVSDWIPNVPNRAEGPRWTEGLRPRPPARCVSASPIRPPLGHGCPRLLVHLGFFLQKRE